MVTDTPQPTIERLWCGYLVCVGVIALVPAGTDASDHVPLAFWLVHLSVAAVVISSYWLARRASAATIWVRTVLGVIGLPVVFSALCWLLPHVHPEPYEYSWLAVDRWLFGDDIARLSEHMPAWLVEVLQVDYAAFYVICIGSTVLVWWGNSRQAYERALLLMTGGFLISYFGYLLVPTIAPKLVLVAPEPLEGLWLTPSIRASIDAAEANHWDCFPSGHTMMTVISLIVLWRYVRRAFLWLLLPALLLIASTMLLRYHWSADVLAGALLAWPSVKLCDWLASRDS